jgi:hypothetical protein
MANSFSILSQFAIEILSISVISDEIKKIFFDRRRTIA